MIRFAAMAPLLVCAVTLTGCPEETDARSRAIELAIAQLCGQDNAQCPDGVDSVASGMIRSACTIETVSEGGRIPFDQTIYHWLASFTVDVGVAVVPINGCPGEISWDSGNDNQGTLQIVPNVAAFVRRIDRPLTIDLTARCADFEGEGECVLVWAIARDFQRLGSK